MNFPKPTDMCYKCKRLGHWSYNCPQKTPTKSPLSNSGNDSGYPTIQCRCGAGACEVKVSTTDKNPGRKYYRCPLPYRPCKTFIKFCDQVTEDDINVSPPPACPCGAGLCKSYKEISGPNAGRSYFGCAIPKGQGACPFKLYDNTEIDTNIHKHVDESKAYSSPQSTCASHEVFDNVKYDLAPEVGNPDDVPSSVITPIPAAQNGIMPTGSPICGKTLDFSSPNQHDPSPCLTFENESSVLDSIECSIRHEAESWNHTEKASRVLRQMSQPEIHSRQIEFWSQISAAEDISAKGIIYQTLSLQMLGWLGRLAFTHPRSLTGIFPSINPISVPQYNEMLNLQELSPVPHPSNLDLVKLLPPSLAQECQPCDNSALWKPSGLKRSSATTQDEDMTNFFKKFLDQVALNARNNLVTMLNSMDPSEHDSMTREAEKFFSALDSLSIDHKPFSGPVREFIEIERLVCNERSSQELYELYNAEEVKLNDISKVHEEAVAAFSASSKNLQSLNEEASRLREMLLEIEEQLACCEVETLEHKTCGSHSTSGRS